MKKAYQIIKLTLFCFLFNILNVSNAQAFWLFHGTDKSKISLQDNATPKVLTIDQLTKKLTHHNKNLRPKVVKLALQAYVNAQKQGVKIQKPILTIIDYSLNSNVKRLWVLDLQQQDILFNSLVAHGKYSGDDVHATSFSDQMGSLESSIGVFLTGSTYTGHRGYTLRIKGLEQGFNANAEARHIVIHGAWYVDESFIKMVGKIGRSWGCPAVEQRMAEPIINTIKDGSLVFAYYPDSKWLQASNFINSYHV